VFGRRWMMTLATLVLLARPAAAAIVADVQAEGHESVSTRELLTAFGVSRGDLLDESVIAAGADSVLALLAASGSPFASIRVDWEDGEEARLVVHVDETRRGRVTAVVVSGNSAIGTAELGLVTSAAEGGPVTAALLESDSASLAALYAERGHPLASVRPVVSMSGVDPGGIVVTYEIVEGPTVTFADVRVIGNERTRPDVITRETGIVRGDPFRASVLDRVRPALERLPFLVSVGEPLVAFSPEAGTADVGIEVAEARANRLSGILGYAPRGDGEGEFTGRAEIDLVNIAGTGRRASASWERVREGHDRIAFEYTEPWLFGAPIDAGVRAEQVNRDTLYSTTEGDLFVTARFNTRLSLTWSAGGERYVPGTGDDPSTDGYRTALELLYERTDSPLNPTRGIESSGGLSYASVEESEGDASYRTGVLTASAAGYLPVRPAQVLALAASGALLASSDESVPLHQQLVLGGAGSLRGYREEQFHGTATALGTVEYRFILGRYSRLAAFIDVGHYSREGSNPTAETKLGYGVGLRGETRLGIIAVDYGLGEGDGFLDGKLHVGLIREF
jgi:outer membrane protein insertion porin family